MAVNTSNISLMDKQLINLLVLVLFINSIIDSVIMDYDDRTNIILFQYSLNILFLAYFFFHRGNIRRNRIYSIMFIIISYFLLLSLLSSDYSLTFNYLAKFVIPFPFFIVGYSVFRTPDMFMMLYRKSLIILFYFIGYIIFCSVFSIGGSFYLKDSLIKTGYMGLQGLYIPTFILIQSVFLIYQIRKPLLKFFIIIAIISGLLIIVVILKRTNIILIALGLLLYLILERKIIMRFIASSILVIGITVYSLIFIFDTEIFQAVYDARSYRFSEDYTLEDEGRYNEIIFIWEEMGGSALELTFGTGEVFNDRPVMTKKADFIGGGLRQAHTSYARLFWSGGIIGLVLFLFLYFKIYRQLRRYYKRLKKSRLMMTFFHLGVSFIILRLLNDFSSGLTYLTFNAFFYVTIGALIRVGEEETNKSSLVREQYSNI